MGLAPSQVDENPEKTVAARCLSQFFNTLLAMAGKKKTPSRPMLPRLLRPCVRFAYRRRAALSAALVLAACLFFGLRLWDRFEGDVLIRPEYALAAQQIQITPPPAWIRADIKAEALRGGNLHAPLSIVDERLAERLAKMFMLHPWVAGVERVTKHYPSHVTIDLIYRRPRAMVEVPGGLFPVDDQAVLLPSEDFSPVDASQYPRIAGIDSQPLGPVGTAWGDANVQAGVRIAVALAEVWCDLGLHSIRRAMTGGESPAQPHFELVTNNGAVIPWGRAPGSEAPGETPVAEKVTRLKKYVADYGGLDESARRGDLDLRVRAGARTAAFGPKT